MMLRQSLIGLLLGSLLASPLQARIYQYVDDTGKKIFVDRLNKVPERFRDQLQVREEERDQLSPELLHQRKQQRNTDRFRLKVSQQRSQIKDAMKKWVTPYRFVANRISLPVKLVYGARSVELELVMDTGASFTVVHQHAISSLGAQLTPGSAARIADGSVVQTNQVVFDRVEIGPYKAKNVRAGVINFQGGGVASQGLLGMDFLLHARYELDRENQQIIWDPEKYQQLQTQLLELETLEQQLQEAAVQREGNSQK